MRANVWLSDRVLQLQSRDLAVDFPIFRLRRPGTRFPWDRSQQIEGAVRQPEQWNDDLTNQQDGHPSRALESRTFKYNPKTINTEPMTNHISGVSPYAIKPTKIIAGKRRNPRILTAVASANFTARFMQKCAVMPDTPTNKIQKIVSVGGQTQSSTMTVITKARGICRVSM